MFQDIRIFRGIDQGKHSSDSDAIVSTERRACSLHFITFDTKLQGVFGEVEGNMLVLLRNHIIMSLQAKDGCFACTHQNITSFVNKRLKGVLTGGFQDVIAQFVKATAGMWQLSDAGKLCP